MSDEHISGDSYPIERGFPIERVNDLAARETRAKLHYRPLSVLHKWWARQLGSVFRAISLYTFLDDPSAVQVTEPGEDGSVAVSGAGTGGSPETPDAGTSDTAAAPEWDSAELADRIDAVALDTPDPLWELYSKDVRVDDLDVLDPFVGAGTSLTEAVRFGATVTGVDLNPVATFLTRQALRAHQVDTESLKEAFETVERAVAAELRSHYETACPNDESHTADVMYALWVRTLECTSCGETVELFKDYRIASGRYGDSDRDVVYCPACASVFTTDDADTDAVCPDCSHAFVPAAGPVSNGDYGCPSCGLRYPMVDAIADGQSYGDHLYAIEYYCPACDDAGADRSTYKGYKSATDDDRARYAATPALDEHPGLESYLPTGEIPDGAVTAASRVSGNDLFQHGYETWRDMFNRRQQYCLATLLSAIDDVEDTAARELLLTAFSDSLAFQSTLSVYNAAGGKIESVFRRNSFTPRVEYAENNVWGTRAGRGTFSNTWDKITRGVAYAQAPTERDLREGETVESAPFANPVGGDHTVVQGDLRDVDLDGQYDVVLTDPPYYDNVIYSELADFYYVWLRLVLEDSHPEFEPEHTPRESAVVSNPATGTDDGGFESQLQTAFERIERWVADDGLVVFTYRHGGVSEWSALVTALCEAGLTPTAVYPVSAGYEQFGAENTGFTVIVAARPRVDSEPVSWPSLRRRLHATVRDTRSSVTDGGTISDGDAGVVALGRCLREFAPHYGNVRRGGDRMATADVIDHIFDAVSGDVSVTDVYLDLLAMPEPTEADVDRLCRGTRVSPEMLAERALVRFEPDFELATWETTARRRYLEQTPPAERTTLDEVQLACVEGTDPEEIGSDVIDLANELASVTGDDSYAGLGER